MRDYPKLYTLYDSTNRKKKYDVYVENLDTGRIKKISFGARNYEDYTIHKDKERRQRYRDRHIHDRIDNCLFPGCWSWHILWGKYTSVEKNMKYVMANIDKLSE